MTNAVHAGLELRRLVVQPGPGFVLAETTLEAQPGEHVALIGPSGSGKSTLLRAVAGFLAPQSGEIRWGDTCWSHAGSIDVSPAARRIGMVAQDLALWPHMTAREHLRFALRCRGTRGKTQRAEADRLLARVGLAERSGHRPAALSGGESQRLALARALAGGSRLLLLDEPLGQLDAALHAALAPTIADVARDMGAAVLHATHDPDDAFNLAQRVAVLEGGRLVAYATPTELAARPTTEFLAAVTGYMGVVRREAGAFVAAALGVKAETRGVAWLQNGCLAIRPDALRMRLESEAAAESGVAGLPAQVTGASFQGGRRTLRVVSSGETLFVEARNAAAPEGSRVRLHLAPG